MNSRITVSGNIVGELSEKIPSNIIALNELIKNSYDAGAKEVCVNLNTDTKTLTITDNGEGMNAEDINTLFHISNSKKVYGVKNQYDRFTQGSKGLGFLSVFKFGNYVKWRTYKDQGLSFGIDFGDLLNSDDISDFIIQVEEDKEIYQGTQIIIQLDDYNTRSLKDYFTIEKNYKKVLNSFDDKSFIILLEINNASYSSVNTQNIQENWKEKQLYYVKYNSQDQKIKFFYNEYQIIEEEMKFTDSRYKLDLELIIFSLPPYGKAKIDSLFLNDKDELTPLVYVNDNLFNNYEIFDPGLMRSIRTASVLSQMIGYIRIISKDSQMGFNSDRSKFLQNDLSDCIVAFLKELNKTIQETGAINKKYLMESDYIISNVLPNEANQLSEGQMIKYIKSDFSFRDQVEIFKETDFVKFSLFGKDKCVKIEKESKKSDTDKKDHGNKATGTPEKKQGNNKNGNSKLKPAKIKLKYNDRKIGIPSGQIDLSSIIELVKNSEENSINFDDVLIKVDGIESDTRILQSFTEEKTIKVEYIYDDKNTGIVVEQLSLQFYIPSSKIQTDVQPVAFITLPTNEDYTISYNPDVGCIIDQINSLEVDNYIQVVACSLRAVIDISLDVIQKSSKYHDFFVGVNGFKEKALKVLTHISGNRTYKGIIARATSIDYHSLDNLLDEVAFSSAISTAHLATHKSTTYASMDSLKHLANKIGLFVVIVNEMISNESIN